jgi:Flp pilus assembly protein TadG
MLRRAHRYTSEKGVALVYATFILTGLMLFSGLAVDTGRAYVVKAQLSKSVDGAALGAARMLNTGNPRAEAARIFKANFPSGYLGTEASDPTASPDFFKIETTESGLNIVTISASATLPTTFMRVANVDFVTVRSSGEATRRMVDLSLVLDVSSSIGFRWPAVRDAARSFINAFDPVSDRIALVTYSNGAKVLSQMPAGRGFDKNALMAKVPNTLPGGSTNMVEGLYRGWDELRSVSPGEQSGLRVIVLFTDGASNSVPGFHDGGVAKGLRTYDFPKNSPDPDNQTWNNPQITGLYDTETGNASPSYSVTVAHWNDTTTLNQVKWLPTSSAHTHHRSSGIPTSFPLQSSSLEINGATQTSVRGLRDQHPITGLYPAQVFNINNAARNLVEIIANEARSDDDGEYRIRIYTIGMGELVRYNLGTIPETSESILKRLANDKTSPDFNDTQLEGKYYFAATEGDVAGAFDALQNLIIRLSK